jgi:vacuolar protein-sorting-associated protein 4
MSSKWCRNANCEVILATTIPMITSEIRLCSSGVLFSFFRILVDEMSSAVREVKQCELHALLKKARHELSQIVSSTVVCQEGSARLLILQSTSLHSLLVKLKHVITLLITFENAFDMRLFLGWAATTLSRIIEGDTANVNAVIGSVFSHSLTALPSPQHSSPNISTEQSNDTVFRGGEENVSQFKVQTPQDIAVSWKHIIGAKSAVTALKQAVVLPRKMPQLFSGGRKPWGCILLYGPPGTGKTLLASASAREADTSFIPVSVSDLLSKWVGDTEKSIRELFETASRCKRCIVFLDEVDALCGARGSSGESEASRRAKTEFLVRMQTVDSRRVTIIAATNLPWELDTAFRRRFDRVIYVGLPDVDERKLLLSHYLTQAQHEIGSSELEGISREQLEGFSPCDIAHVCQHAAMLPIERLQAATHFCCVKKSIPPEHLQTSTNTVHHHQSGSQGGGDASDVDADAINSVDYHHHSDSNMIDFLVPCSPDAPGAFPATLDDLDPSLIASPHMITSDLLEATRSYPLTVSKEYLQQYETWESSLRAR